MAAMFQAQTANWEETQEKMSQLVSPYRHSYLSYCSISSHINVLLQVRPKFTLIRVVLASPRAEASRSPRPRMTDLCPRATCAIDVDRKVCRRLSAH